ncbi:hypothetical protein JS528_03630 [Bifidobacterium sp. MA2]|uniref:Transposase n=1 Tax=Bifidobacterium santillanense TaxID=2809028 RepID=A0ABS5UNH4_9BIFI|nr:hypothetical protein [Bifidobacterium santillanense]MBT1172466.1 hypothetical protein [Bifidobacterium santillanense]
MTFTKEQIKYLESLPAVEHATATRITYADAFKRQCLERYSSSASPTALFREAGLDPKLVGYKRIERSFARWRNRHDVPQYSPDAATAKIDSSPFADDLPNMAGADPRDLLIARQLHRIDELERELADLLRVTAV